MHPWDAELVASGISNVTPIFWFVAVAHDTSSDVPRAAPCAIRTFIARMAHPEWLECASMAQGILCWFQKCQSQISTTTRSASKWQFLGTCLKFIHAFISLTLTPLLTHTIIYLFIHIFIYSSIHPSIHLLLLLLLIIIIIIIIIFTDWLTHSLTAASNVGCLEFSKLSC